MKILIIEDDTNLANGIAEALKCFGDTCIIRPSVEKGLFVARTEYFDAIVLDHMLEDGFGMDFCEKYRSEGKNTPIIVCSAVDDEALRINYLKMGADDFIVKPFSASELHAKLGVFSRRVYNLTDKVYYVNDLTINTDTYSVYRNNVAIILTKKEFCILEILVKNKGKLVTKAVLNDMVWSGEFNPFSNTLETHIKNIRKKIKEGHYIETVPGRGYILRDKNDTSIKYKFFKRKEK